MCTEITCRDSCVNLAVAGATVSADTFTFLADPFQPASVTRNFVAIRNSGILRIEQNDENYEETGTKIIE